MPGSAAAARPSERTVSRRQSAPFSGTTIAATAGGASRPMVTAKP
ncbi:hypothetical protein [Streptomyces kanamyceticus]|nr:hypothetical protein [Streptomyces kanamyceticus]